MNAEEVIVAISIMCNGDWEMIYNTVTKRDHLYDSEERIEFDRSLEKFLLLANEGGYKYTTILSDDYPEILKHEQCPPFVLFYHGDLSLINEIGKNVAVIGSRDYSEYGKLMTEKIVKTISQDCVVVSGMARGIDTIAHLTAINNGGKTIAVLGGGINNCYPVRNKKLYEELKKNHLVISEYPGDMVPDPINFPRRNRIIALLSCGVVVTEAHQRSGTMTTVMHALHYNRLVFCVPYRATEESECNRLIGEGAYLVQSGEDVLSILEKDNHL